MMDRLPMLDRLPILKGFAGFTPGWIRADVPAGLAIATVAVPSAIAYPAIAGLPPEVGLYASLFPLIGYALFGPSRQLIVGPDAPTMTVLAGVLASLTAATPADRVAASALLALTVGVMCLIAGRLRFGVVAAFLSRPILLGFISGVALSILVGQIGRFTGLRIESDGLISPLIELARKAGGIHWPSAALGGGLLVLLLLLNRWKSPIPGPLAAVTLAILASWAFGFEALGMKVVGPIPQGFPALSLPLEAGLPLKEVLLGAAAVWLVSFGSGIVAARSFGARGRFEVDPNAELTGLGAANIAAGLFSGFPVTVSDSRTAVNLSVGGRSQLAGLVAALSLAVLLLYLNDALRLLPVPALGAILGAAALSLIDLRGFAELWRISRMEFAFALISLWGALTLGVLNGVMIAVAATLAYVLLKEMRPREAMLGRLPGHPGFYKLHREPRARPVPGLAVCMIQGSLLFFNVDYVRALLKAHLGALPAGTRWFVIDASAIAQVDSTAATMLAEVQAEFAAQGVALGIAELHRDPMEILERAGTLETIGAGMIFDDLEEVIPAFGHAGAHASRE
ncbi:SulP family inorganic anion transporter [Starkeya koreensis]|uniref:SulP family inorganic anion transporter n=1 Tax=Ancylobacter koreensis TaxID=266121 RepID=A0ABT0DJG0_9HYPH|nr:SulP family inorganic anion transporter [Ancylobacter koreensis]MCK0207412.1 SulP family inorganic anion transporter [Ancylobacter koreensis]